MIVKEKKESRDQNRRRVYLGEGIKIIIKDIDQAHSFTGEATDISPWGISVVINDQQFSMYPKIGDTVHVFYSNRDKITGATKAKIVNRSKIQRRGEDIICYGLEFISDYFLESIGKEERKIYEPAELFNPHAWCCDPFFFQEKIMFRVIGFSAEGLRLVTSARNKSFLPDLLLNLKVYLPVQGEFDLAVKVLTTENPSTEQAKNRYIVVVKFENPSIQFMQAMVEYILFCGVDASPLELRREKLPVTVIEKSLSFYYGTTQADLDIILKLRQTCLFDDRGVINSDTITEQQDALVENYSLGFDSFDESSRQIICKMGRKPISCVRIIFNNKDRNKCEIASAVEAIPDWLWGKRFIEISRLAWEKEYRESDVFINLSRHIIRIALESGHSHLLTSAPAALKQLYLKIGFQPLPLVWKKDVEESRKKEYPMLLDAKSILKGDYILDKAVWNKIYAPVAKHLGIK